MPSEIFLTKYNKEMHEVTISNNEWGNCVATIENVRLEKDEKHSLVSVECHCAALDDWIPIFWINKNGSGTMRQSGFFQFEESYEKAIEIAENLGAVISGEEGILLYEPNYGAIFDDCAPEKQIILTIDELIENKVYSTKNVKDAIHYLIIKK